MDEGDREVKSGHFSRNGFLTVRGYEHAQQRSLEGLRPKGDSVIVDTSVSVSALVEGEELHVWDDQLLDEQFRRACYGS